MPKYSIPLKDRDCLALLRQDGMAISDAAQVMPLPGGVSSEIHLIRDGEQAFVVKRALAQLRVAEDWRADRTRNGTEQRFLRYVGSFLPKSVPRILFASEGNGYFCMEYFGEDFTNWKAALLSGECSPRRAGEAMSLLARIHSASRGRPEVAKEFDTTETFHQLRTSPYLLRTAERHPRLADFFEDESLRMERTRECLVHGDFSPKNILLGPNRMIVLDCEAAWYGDPAFDVAFFLNHLCLKGLYHAPRDPGLRALFDAAVDGYFPAEPNANELAINRRSARLLLMLMLARIDGKSPVEYLQDDKKKNFVRTFVSAELPRFSGDLREISSLWFEQIEQYFRRT